MFFIDKDGNYYQGDRIDADDIEVEQRPSALHVYQDGEWVYVAPPLEEQFHAVKLALQAAIDVKAQEFGFSNGNSLILYASFTNPFKSTALPFAQWEASVWMEAETYRQEVIAGSKPIVSPEEAVGMMPAYP